MHAHSMSAAFSCAPFAPLAARLGLDRGARVVSAFARDPREAYERARDQIAERREQYVDPPRYTADERWDETLRAIVGAETRNGDDLDAEFADVWRGVQDTFSELQLRFGRATFGGWDDGDPALARATWSVVRRLRPSVVVETGVGRGVTTRVILEAMARNGHGHLWSIDVPPLLERSLADETAAVVPESLKDRWTFVLGSSRRRLRGLLDQVGHVDVFLHDSFHTARNLLFEWESAFRRLRRPGALLADDVHRNIALAEFTQAHSTVEPIVCRHDDGVGLFAVLIARG
jgi:predicted O-methyltransferase YrrM